MSLNMIIVLSQRYEILRIKPEGSQKEREAERGRGMPGRMGASPRSIGVSRVYDHSMSRTNRTEEVRRLYRVNVRPLLNSTIHPELELCSELDQ